MAIRILKEGFHTTIQDVGRVSYRNIGVPISGAMDDISCKVTNWIVFNDETAPVLECTLIGPELLFESDALIAVGGKGFVPVVDGEPYQLFQAILIKAGNVLRLESNRTAARAYMAVQGGFHIEKIMNSYSTYTRGKFGGLNGRPLLKGDLIPFSPPTHFPKNRWFLSHSLLENLYRNNTIRFIKGNQADWFSSEMFSFFQATPFTITPQSDRMGYRLDGMAIDILKGQELVTEGTTPGTIQIPPNGKPIVLMRDSQVTGGYPKIGTVISSDLSVLGQKRPGDQIYFREVSLDEAYQIKKDLNQTLSFFKKRILWQRCPL
ncbi:antagonist of KipI [Bacillus oleivorans]|uniref:Antagonist of KipI n=1 Tax=Bacillus oleivorans TaxID=1448271 RepID=A0A285CN51_9BACI|nr:biotin-dependent carboxyltransferase family protein [Bacillus oleivorans]SNX68423.1 antagonist of KipI [Bacillus oleivorans]